MPVLHLRNPHSVLAALQSRPRDVLEVIIPSAMAERAGKDEAGHGRDAWIKVAQVAEAKGVKVRSGGGGQGGGGRDSRGGGDHRRGGGRDSRGSRDAQHAPSHALPDIGRTGGAEALVKEREGVTAEELFRGAKDRADGHGLWLALDSLTDPQNVGAIFRTASFFGVQGILLTQERSAPLTGTVYDVAAGGLESVPFAIQPNLQRAFEVAKDAGLWILGTSEHAQQSFRQVERDRPWMLVLGNEEKGMRRLTEESCDVVCQVPPQGLVTSLNVSVAAGVLISALSR